MKFLKKILFLPALFGIFIQNASAQTNSSLKAFRERLTNTAESGAGFAPATGQTLSVAVGVFIRTVLGFVGVLFLALVIYAGILWMTARGNEEKATDARKIMMNAAIGLGITLAAYIITQTVILWLS